ncbi:hypothetical protein FDH38_gp014 [Dinoroseobacter phage vB_DshS-R5C]|uniref:Uncharacterized protein n=1 Tax=Dinoroseobacter phage vB_DshS-R5C TaxID=1965368 RepID=A0A1V0DY58_9CAUD|nr:hypothetical protein FDH38_gp014 [Dinoroseobacter phage vB_DshS-R5C]ARB06068.1 hypothetical protein vBDshSR5C_14 [Dinoroseobacter phage vB_DshS-R5C]
MTTYVQQWMFLALLGVVGAMLEGVTMQIEADLNRIAK